MKIIYPDKRLVITDAVSSGGGKIIPQGTYNNFNSLGSDAYDITDWSDIVFNQSHSGYIKETGVSDGDLHIDFDFTTSINCEYIFIGRADWYVAGNSSNITITISGANISDFSVKEDIITTLGVGDLQGFNFLEELTFTTSYRYYRVAFSGASNSFQIKRLWLGSFFELNYGADENSNYSLVSNSKYIANENFILSYSYVDKTIKENLYNNILKNKDIINIGIYDVNNDFLLDKKLQVFKILSYNLEVLPYESYDFTIELANDE